jgi:hypothetical protein
MSRRDKLGLGILLTLFVIFCVLLAITIEPFGEPRDPEDSVFVQTRIKHLQNQQND